MKTNLLMRNFLTPLLVGGLAFGGLGPRGMAANPYDSDSQATVASAQPEQQPGCNNLYGPGTWRKSCECKNGKVNFAAILEALISVLAGINPVATVSGSVQREVNDITAPAGAGGLRLEWTRYAQSRLITGLQHFGDGHGWRHTYQWEMSDVSASQVDITEPEGTTFRYTQSGSTWAAATITNQNTLVQYGSDFYLTRVDGTRFHFRKLGTGTSGDPYYYQLQHFNDGFGQVSTCSYNAAKKLVLVTEPAGRWLRINYQDISVDRSNFKTLATVTAQPPASAWSQLTVTNPTAFRYLRYYSTEPELQSASYSQVSEIEFYNTAGVKLTGTTFGAGPPWQNNWAYGWGKAFDGNTGTGYKYSGQHYGFTGIDLGAGNEAVVGKVKYWPSGQPGAMVGCQFQGSNTAPVVKNVIASVELGYGSPEVIISSVQYTYQTMPDVVLDMEWLLLKNATYADGAQAAYAYKILNAGQRPLLKKMDDPRVVGDATKIRYEFWKNGYIHGNIYAERDYDTEEILALFTGVGADNYTNMGRKTGYKNGTTKEMLMTSENRPTWIKDALGRLASFTYNSNGFLSSSTDAAGRVATYTRDAKGRILGVVMPDGSRQAWTRNSAGYVLSETDGRGKVTTYVLDTENRVTQLNLPDGSYETFTYNSFGQPLTHRMRNGGTETMTYNARGLLVARADALGNVTTFTYGADDRVATVAQPAGNSGFGALTTGLTYNDRGQVTGVQLIEAGTGAGLTYDAYGNQLTATDENGNTSSASYDEFRRMLTRTTPLGKVTAYEYDELGGCCGGSGGNGADQRVSTVTLPSGKQVHFDYDLAGQMTSQTEGFGSAAAAVTAMTYDLAGRVVTRTDGRGKVWGMSYDALDRRKTETDPLGKVTTWNYDAAGNVTAEVRPDAGTTVNTYDSVNRLLTSTDPKAQVTAFAYGRTAPNDGGTTLHRLTDGKGQVTTFAYDVRDARTRKTYADGTHDDWSYTASGRLAAFTSASGRVATFSYDARQRPVLKDWSDSTPDVTSTYDAGGRLVTLNSQPSSLNYAYDADNRLISETQDLNSPVNLPAKTVSYDYDADGNRTTLTYPDGTVVAYTYTARNQVGSISAGGLPPLATYTYDLAGNRTGKTLENGTGTTYGYDHASRLLGLEHKRSGVSFQKFDYALNNVGNRTSRAETNAGTARLDTYGYDAVNQVTQARYNVTNAGAAEARKTSFAYDAAATAVVCLKIAMAPAPRLP